MCNDVVLYILQLQLSFAIPVSVITSAILQKLIQIQNGKWQNLNFINGH